MKSAACMTAERLAKHKRLRFDCVFGKDPHVCVEVDHSNGARTCDYDCLAGVLHTRIVCSNGAVEESV